MADNETYWHLDQLLGTSLGEDWAGEFDGEDDAVADWFNDRPGARTLQGVITDIDALFHDVPTEEARRGQFRVYAFTSGVGFDDLLRGIRERAVRALEELQVKPA